MLVSDTCVPSNGRGTDSYEGNLQVHGVFTYVYVLPSHLHLSPSRVDSGVTHFSSLLPNQVTNADESNPKGNHMKS